MRRLLAIMVMGALLLAAGVARADEPKMALVVGESAYGPGLDLANPVGMAAGFDKNGEVPRPLALLCQRAPRLLARSRLGRCPARLVSGPPGALPPLVPGSTASAGTAAR